ncbi:NAD(P)-dependent oxidoreductase [Phytohabitans rumicis]|uniref:6-phosphogluconate dehydrogenase n=1 Tax=Phytohabitans rumicis TaxID=1076125 RepID=A0A6V8LGU0_9ACTN|nr:NAD(P)-dependent oxidoreductase [Phytohabitans rumicis]GFJ96472.1 6-phosphogluconate dehydrogenase [Phytohabitans rumicis]
MTDVAVIGLGVMGSAIARRLLAAGHRTHVYDVRPEAVAELAAEGAVPAARPADLAGCEPVLLSLNTATIVEQAVFGPGGVLADPADGTLLVDMSSIDPASTRDLATRAERRGAAWVDAPLSGGAPGALRGELTLMLGGRDEDVARALPVLGVLASRTTHLGPVGAGQLGKLVNQVLVGCGFAALAEAAALVRAAGLPAEQILTALTGGRADSALLQEFFTKFAAVDLSPTGRVANMVKDLEIARDFARTRNVPLPMTTAVSELHRWLVARDHGGSDNAALMLYYTGGAEA